MGPLTLRSTLTHSNRLRVPFGSSLGSPFWDPFLFHVEHRYPTEALIDTL